MKCKFEYDTQGLYILPLICFSKVNGKWAFWFGWGFWLWGFEITNGALENQIL